MIGEAQEGPRLLLAPHAIFGVGLITTGDAPSEPSAVEKQVFGNPRFFTSRACENEDVVGSAPSLSPRARRDDDR